VGFLVMPGIELTSWLAWSSALCWGTMILVNEHDSIDEPGQGPTMENDWLGAIFTAFLLAPPSVLGIRALIRGPTRFAGKVVPIRMDRLAAAVWLSVFPLTIAIVFIRLAYSPPRTYSEADHLANEWGPLVLRALSVTCLLIGGAIALLTSRPEVKPKVSGKRRARTKKRKR
jgi:hypothetical protein